MRNWVSITALILLATVGLMAQGRGRGSAARSMPLAHNSTATTRSNAPWSADRDRGKDRAEDAGKGKKKGLGKVKANSGHKDIR